MNATSFRQLRLLMVAIGVVIAGVTSVASVAQASEIKQTMNDMKRALNSAMNSSSISEFAQYASRLQSSASAASKLNYGSDPALYRQGMQALQLDIERMNLAIQANDLKAAKDALRRINSTKKSFHDKIG